MRIVFSIGESRQPIHSGLLSKSVGMQSHPVSAKSPQMTGCTKTRHPAYTAVHFIIYYNPALRGIYRRYVPAVYAAIFY